MSAHLYVRFSISLQKTSKSLTYMSESWLFEATASLSHLYVRTYKWAGTVRCLICAKVGYISAILIGFPLVCPQGIANFGENQTPHKISEIIDRPLKKSRKSGNFLKRLFFIHIHQENYTDVPRSLRISIFRPVLFFLTKITGMVYSPISGREMYKLRHTFDVPRK